MKRILTATPLFAMLFAAMPLAAQTVSVKEETPGLLKMAKVTPAAASATALARVPNGRVQSAELEKEDGKLLYSFDIKVAGKSGIEEVQVDAMTGAVLSAEHETPADEAKEAKEDKAKAAKAKAELAKTAQAKRTKPPAR